AKIIIFSQSLSTSIFLMEMKDLAHNVLSFRFIPFILYIKYFAQILKTTSSVRGEEPLEREHCCLKLNISQAFRFFLNVILLTLCITSQPLGHRGGYEDWGH
ncbi:hypothetical protein ACJX0J_039966, partial [Zea mays]